MNGFGARPSPAAMSAIVRPEATERSCRSRAVGVAAPLLVAVLDQQPVGPRCRRCVVLHPHQHPAAVQPLAVQRELQVALRQALLRRHALRRPVAAVPQLHRAAAVLALGDGALEVAVVERVVLDLHGQALVVRVERGAAGHRPGLEHAVEFEPQVVMQPGGVVLLDDEAQRVGGRDAASPLGSAVSLKSRLAWYVSSLRFAMAQCLFLQERGRAARRMEVAVD